MCLEIAVHWTQNLTKVFKVLTDEELDYIYDIELSDVMSKHQEKVWLGKQIDADICHLKTMATYKDEGANLWIAAEKKCEVIKTRERKV